MYLVNCQFQNIIKHRMCAHTQYLNIWLQHKYSGIRSGCGTEGHGCSPPWQNGITNGKPDVSQLSDEHE